MARLRPRACAGWPAATAPIRSCAINSSCPSRARRISWTSYSPTSASPGRCPTTKPTCSSPTLPDSYEAERHPVEQSVLQQTDFVTRLIALERPVARTLRDRLAAVLSSFDAVQQRARNTVSELAVHYRRSPIVEEHWLPQG